MEKLTLLRNIVRYITRMDHQRLLYILGGSTTVLGTPTELLNKHNVTALVQKVTITIKTRGVHLMGKVDRGLGQIDHGMMHTLGISSSCQCINECKPTQLGPELL